jgi:hypothetical protein
MTLDDLLHLIDRAERGALSLAEAALLRAGVLDLAGQHPEQPAGRRFPRPFVLFRPHDPERPGDTGDFAEGVVWSDGTAALRLRGTDPHVCLWPELAAALAAHHAEGLTSVEWPPDPTDGDDGELARSAATVSELRDYVRRLRATLDRVPRAHRPSCPHGYVEHQDSCPVCDINADRRRALLGEPAHELAERLDVAAQLASALCDHLPGDAWHLADAVHRLCAGEITPRQALDETAE